MVGRRDVLEEGKEDEEEDEEGGSLRDFATLTWTMRTFDFFFPLHLSPPWPNIFHNRTHPSLFAHTSDIHLFRSGGKY
jgi:hypothetical protein